MERNVAEVRTQLASMGLPFSEELIRRRGGPLSRFLDWIGDHIWESFPLPSRSICAYCGVIAFRFEGELDPILEDKEGYTDPVQMLKYRQGRTRKHV